MIPEYKFYHGAVLAEIIHESPVPVQIDELYETGRLSSYILDSRVGMQIKHATQRLHPWSFTFHKGNVKDLVELRASFPNVFVMLVCQRDGIVCIDLPNFLNLLDIGQSEQGWLRVDRKPGKWYEVSGGKSDRPTKYPQGIDILLDALHTAGRTRHLSLSLDHSKDDF